MRIVPLSSSSRGNAYLVARGGEALLIDCGLCYRELARRLAVCGGDRPEIVGVLLTHNHDDHISGLKTFLKHHDVPVFANAMTAAATVAHEGVSTDAFAEFENGEDFEVGGFRVHPFSIPHDTPDPVGYTVCADDEVYFHATDVGTPLDSIGEFLKEATVATLESNHDVEMLLKSGRHPSLIQRIRGPRGHLSNDDACELVRKFASSKLKRLTLAHLSHDCNTPSLAELAMRETLAAMRRTDIELGVAL